MADTPSSILLLRLQSTGSNTNLWGGYINTALSTLEQASKGWQSLAVTGNATISWTNYATGNMGQCAFLKLTGALSSAAILTFPTYQNSILVWNNTGALVTIMCSGGTGVAIPNGRKTLIACDGSTDYYSATASWNSDTITASNANDLMTFSAVSSAIAVLVGLTVNGLVLNSVGDTTAGYLSSKITTSLSGLTTTQVSGLVSVQISTVHAGGNEQILFQIGQGYVGGFLNGGYQNAQFTPVVGNGYDVDCTAGVVTVSLSGMTTPQLGQEIKLNKYGAFNMFLLGTVNSGTNFTVSQNGSAIYRYSGSTWGWN